jgi:peptide/nickel transport system substrate-binding protein
MMKKVFLLIFCAVFLAGPSSADDDPIIADEVVIGIGRNLYYAHSSWHIVHGSLMVWEPLIYSDADLNPQPYLATGWESDEDAIEWTITLREGVMFHDGTLLTAKIAAESLAGALENYGPIAALESIEAVDDMTLKLTLSEPTPSLPHLLSYFSSAMLSPASHQQEESEMPIPYGTGPYRFEDYVQGEQIVLVRNEDYWGELPPTKRIVYRYIPDVTTRLLALQSGEIDAIADVGGILPAQGEIVEADTNLRLLLQDVTTTHYLFFNTGKAPFDNADLRRAVSLAVDRALLVEQAVYGYGVPAVSLFTQLATNWINPKAMPTYDLERAAELAESALGGERVTVIMPINSGLANRWPYTEIAQILQYTLADLGLDIDIQVVEGGMWNDMLGNGEYGLSIRPFTMTGDPEDFTTWVRSDGQFNINYSMSYANPRVDELADLALTEVDAAKRRAYYDELQEIVIADAPLTSIYHEVTLYATRANVYDLTLDLLFRPSLDTAYKVIE